VSAVDKRALAAVEDVFEDVVRRWSVVDGSTPSGAPTVEIDLNHSHVSFSILWAGEGFPADVDAALRSARMEAIHESSALPLVVARRISPGAARTLEDRGVSWVDEAGRASVHADPGLLIVIDHERPARQESRRRPSARDFRWASGTAAVGEALLTRAQRDPGSTHEALPTVVDVAEVAGVSAALVSRALQGFDAAGWTAKSGAARGPRATRVLKDPAAMLSSWASWHASRGVPRVFAHAIVDDPDLFVADRIARRWPAKEWALTGWLALQHVAPFVTSVPLVSVYLAPSVFDDKSALQNALTESGLRRVERGARVEILRADGPVLSDAEPDTPTGGAELPNGSDVEGRRVSTIRLYGDLLKMGARGPEAAEHLRELRMGF